MPYIKKKGIRDLYLIKISRVDTRKEPWTDKDLYEKYDLSPDEVRYVESMIKPMADEKLQ